MRALHRFAHHDEADFVLDEASAATEEGEAAQTMQVAAMS
jgi:hypothetical protein